ncbi:MAG TPA: FecR domain-containing protein [Candidatus Angelobacter sp.]|nr:FecR domain-containing protein [Candidatus Angelobacter sp.]
MKLSRITAIASSFLAVILSAPAFAAPGANSALPGTLNYVEGQVNIGQDAINSNAVGTALQPDESLQTGNGKAEILLTPGVFLRVDDNSSVRMISPSITNTSVEVEQGRAMVEVAEIHDQNNLRISEGGLVARLDKKGLYEFDADRQEIVVFDGKAVVQDGDHDISINGGQRLDLNSDAKLKAHGFDKDEYKQSDLYQWSSLRSSYLAEANVNAASTYVADGYYGPGWVGAGWYWSPVFGGYTYVPAAGVLYSPFGFGFYSPLVVYRSPLFFRYGGFGPHYVGGFRSGIARFHGPVVARGSVITGRPVVRSAPAFRGGFVRGGGFHGGGHFVRGR